MSFWFLLVAFTASLNPCRLRRAFPRGPATLALGSLLVLGAGTALALSGRAVLAALDISPESFRLAAALVLTLEAARALLFEPPTITSALPGLRAALEPVAFPLLLQPGVVVLALAAGGDDVSGLALGALAVALLLVIGTGFLPSGPRAEALLAAGGRLLGALEIVVGVALAVDALRDV